MIVQAEFRPAEVAGGPGQIGADLGDGSLEARPCAARQLASLGGRMGRRVLAPAHLHHLDVGRRPAARGPEDLARLLLAHGPRRMARLALRQVDELGDVPADEVVLLGSPDRPDERALDLYE